MQLPIEEECFFDLDALSGESGVEMSVEAAPIGAVFVEGDKCSRYVQVQGEIKDLKTEADLLKDSIIGQAKPDWMRQNVGATKLDTSIPVCHDTGTEIKFVATGSVKSIPLTKPDGSPNPRAGTLVAIMGKNVDKCYITKESFEFSLDAIPDKHRQKLRAFLADLGIAPKKTYVPKPHMNMVGQVPAGPSTYLTPKQQAMLEEKLGARTFSLRTK